MVSKGSGFRPPESDVPAIVLYGLKSKADLKLKMLLFSLSLNAGTSS